MAIKFSLNITEGAKVIVPISMGSDIEGEKLKDLIDALKEYKCDITVLIADTLQQHNSNYEDALNVGNAFLGKNQEILQGVNTIRWFEYIESKKALFEENRLLIETHAKEGSVFYNKMLRTQNKCAVSKDIESSLKYQKEEYAVFLTMSEFDYHVYPKRISDGMAWLYKEFPDIKKPQYVQASFINLEAKYTQQLGIFKNRNSRHENSLPLALRLAYENLETLLSTSEIPEEAKQVFKERVTNLFILTDEENNKKKARKLVIIN